MNNITPVGQFCIRLSFLMLAFWSITSYMILDVNPLHWSGLHRFVTCCYSIFSVIYSYDKSFNKYNNE
jgi:hypothetical protein